MKWHIRGKRMAALWKNINLKIKLILSFALVSSLMILSTGIIIYHICSARITGIVTEDTQARIEKSCDDISRLFEDIVSLGTALGEDYSMQQNLRNQFDTIQECYSQDLAVSMDLMLYSGYNRDIFGIYVFGDNGGKYKSNYASFLLNDVRETQWYQTVHAADAPVWFAPHVNSFVVRTPYTPFISTGVPFINKATGKASGVVLIDIETARLAEIMDYELNEYGLLMILDEQGQLVDLLPSGGAPANKVNEGLLLDIRSDRESKNYITISKELPHTGWRLVGVVDKRSIAGSLDAIKVIVGLLLVIAGVVSVLLANQIAGSVTRPIRKLIVRMELLQTGDLDVAIPSGRSDEIGVLYRSFNHMAAEMKNLIQAIYREQEKLRKEELKALQAQISPHFLYNTLDSIIWELRLKKVPEGIHMLQALTSFFRISLSGGQDIITIEQELKHVESYLSIQKMRYSEQFDYSIDADPRLLSCETPKLVLQPLVENALYHGIKVKDGRCELRITVEESGNEIRMTVADTGAGIDPDRLRMLNQQLEELSSDQPGTGYGLRNVNDKIKIYFGKDYGVSITSEPGAGSKVVLRMLRRSKGGIV